MDFLLKHVFILTFLFVLEIGLTLVYFTQKVYVYKCVARKKQSIEI